jgi:hypothetical protein
VSPHEFAHVRFAHRPFGPFHSGPLKSIVAAHCAFPILFLLTHSAPSFFADWSSQ